MGASSSSRARSIRPPGGHSGRATAARSSAPTHIKRRSTMIGRFAVSLALVVTLASSRASAHELWFQPPSGPKAATVRLTFADTPDPGEAERVAEIAHAKVWGDG